MSAELRREVAQTLRGWGLDVEESVRFDWLTSKAPIEPPMKIDSQVTYRLLAIHKKLGGDFSLVPAKRIQYLRIDFRVGGSTLLQLDTLPHFSSGRLATLGMYEGLRHSLDLDSYRTLCIRNFKAADKYQRTRVASDFPFAGGRTRQRAYFDVVRDLVVPCFGLRLIRIPLPEGVMTPEAELNLKELL